MSQIQTPQSDASVLTSLPSHCTISSMSTKSIFSVAGYRPQDNHYLESLFTQMNGYLGIRGYHEEGIPGHEGIPASFSDGIPSSPQQYVAGYFDKSPVTGNSMVNLPTLRRITLQLAGEKLDLATGKVTDYTRTLDLECALSSRSFTWTSPSGKRTALSFRSFLSASRHHIHALRLSITPLNWSGEIILSDIFDTTGKTLRHHHYDIVAAGELGLGHACEIRTRTSKMRAAFASGYLLRQAPLSTGYLRSDRAPARTLTCRVASGRALEVVRLLSVCTDFDQEANGKAARARNEAHLRGALKAGWNTLLKEQKKSWAALWEPARITIEGDPDSDLKLRFCVFQLLQSYRPGDSRLSIGAKFLSGDHYVGHYFWDTEVFIFPFFLHTMPEAARNLVEYRLNQLKGAQRKARLKKFKGAFYPWESSPIDPDENCPEWWQDEGAAKPVYIPCGDIELHINTAVVHAATDYLAVAEACPDKATRSRVDQLIVESARFWASRGTWKKGRFIIKNVIGPDEYHEFIDNNAYTNHTARWNLQLALEVARDKGRQARAGLTLRAGETAEWQRIIDKMEMGTGNTQRIIAQDETYLTLKEFDFSTCEKGKPVYKSMTMDETSHYQLCKQADVLALFHLYPHRYELDLMNRCWDYYEPRTVHDSNLSAGTHSIVGSLLNRQADAMRYFRKVLDLDAANGSHNVAEGLHAANTGNAWNAAILGFGGISCDGQRLYCVPRLPAGWKSLSFTTFYKARRIAFRITPRTIRLSIGKGVPVEIMVEGHILSLAAKARTLTLDREPLGVIFDLDGVLVDSAICHYRAWKAMADELGIHFDEKRNDLLRGVSRRESLMLMINDQVALTESQIQDLMHRKNELYKEFVNKAGPELLLPGVKSFLTRLKLAGYKLGVASSSKNTPALLKQSGLDQFFFDAVADGNDIRNTKPDPEVFLLAARRMGVRPARCLVVEDAPAGTDGARRARMGVWGIGEADLGRCHLHTPSIAATDIEAIYRYFSLA